MSNSPILVVISILVGLLFAYVLYSKKSHVNEQTIILIAFLRVVSVSILVYLLLGQFVKQEFIDIQKSKLIFLFDNSRSVNNKIVSNDIISFQQKIKSNSSLSEKFDIHFYDLNTELNLNDTLKFNSKTTNFQKALDLVNSNFVNENIEALVLVSDGICNDGANIVNEEYPFKIFTVGIGDTAQFPDFAIKKISFNENVNVNTISPVEVQVNAFQLRGEKLNIILFENDILIDQKSYEVSKNKETIVASFKVSSSEQKLKKYRVEINPLGSEKNIKNNLKEFVIDFIEVKNEILIVSPFPHPDIKALKSVFDKNPNFNIDVFIEGQGEPKSKKYNLIVFYQYPSFSSQNQIINKFSNSDINKVFIVGATTNINELNLLLKTKISVNYQQDKVSAEFNSQFSKFKIEDNWQALVDQFPPVVVPFGEYNLGDSWDNILAQKISKVLTNKPLIAVKDDFSSKTLLIVGEGYYQWKLSEFELNNNNDVFNQLFVKAFNLVLTNNQNKKFVFAPISRDFDIDSKIIFNVELYNDLGENKFGETVFLKIFNKKTKREYSFKYDESIRNQFSIYGLEKGFYYFEAKVGEGKEAQIIKGDFNVSETDIELYETTANWDYLKQIAIQNEGNFESIKDVNNILNNFKNLDIEQKIEKREILSEIISLRWFIFTILFIISLEWFVRKLYSLN